MNAKENARRIIQFDNPEKIVPGPPVHEVAYCGCHHENIDGSGGHHLPVGSKWTDIWGTGWELKQAGIMGFPQISPLRDLPAALNDYVWPDPVDERICGRIYDQAKEWNRDETFLCGCHRDTLWEKAYMLVGMENLMCNFHSEPEAVQEICEQVMNFQLGIASHYLEIGVEMVYLSDDLGSQSGLMLSPDIIEKFLLPQYRRLFDLYKKNNILVNFHCCGHVIPVLDMFLDLGVDILNPVQASANDLDTVRRITRGRIALMGAVSSSLIMSGPLDAIRQEAAQRIRQLGKEGGYFCAPDQFMPYPEENLSTLYGAVEEFGRYPLTKAL